MAGKTRVLHKKSVRKHTHFIRAFKPNLSLWAEGISEIQTIYSLDFDNDVLVFYGQNHTLLLKDQAGDEFSYTPDFFAYYISSQQLTAIEAKTADYPLKTEEYSRLKWSLRKYKDLAFKQIIPSQLYSAERLQNYTLLHPFLKISPTSRLPVAVIRNLMGDAFTLGDFKAAIEQKRFDASYAYGYIAHQLVCFDWDEAVDENSWLSFP